MQGPGGLSVHLWYMDTTFQSFLHCHYYASSLESDRDCRYLISNSLLVSTSEMYRSPFYATFVGSSAMATQSVGLGCTISDFEKHSFCFARFNSPWQIKIL